MAAWTAKVTVSPGPPRRGAGSSANRTSTSTQPAASAGGSPGRRPCEPTNAAASQAQTGTATASRYSARTGGPAGRARAARSPPGMLVPPEPAEAYLASCFRRTTRPLPYRIAPRLERCPFGLGKASPFGPGPGGWGDRSRRSARQVGAAVGLGAEQRGAEGEQGGAEGQQQGGVAWAGVGQRAHLVARLHLVVGEADAGAVRPLHHQADAHDPVGGDLVGDGEAAGGAGGRRQGVEHPVVVLIEDHQVELAVAGQLGAGGLQGRAGHAGDLDGGVGRGRPGQQHHQQGRPGPGQCQAPHLDPVLSPAGYLARRTATSSITRSARPGRSGATTSSPRVEPLTWTSWATCRQCQWRSRRSSPDRKTAKRRPSTYSSRWISPVTPGPLACTQAVAR